MEIHRFEKLWLVVSLVLIVGFIATITYGSVAAGITMVSDSGGTIEPSNFDGTGFDDPGVRHVGGDEYEVYVVAQQFYFNPGSSEPIRLPADSRVTFYLTTPDVIHGFAVVGTNLNTMVIPGQVTKVTVEFDEPGEYGIVCNEYCGSGHHTMEGMIEVVPQDEYEGESQ
jgi:cytochrome c oxidase subunit 2